MGTSSTERRRRRNLTTTRFSILMIFMAAMARMPKSRGFAATISRATAPSISTSTTALFAGVRTRGLEQNKEGPTPTEGGMTLYCKAAEDGKSIGDCPFAHYDRLVLEEKGLPYTLQPTAPDNKPGWLVEYYEGKMPALRHRKECYVESSVIAEYLEYFFPEPSLSVDSDIADSGETAEEVLDGFFPAVAKFLKDTEDSEETLTGLKTKLQQLEDHLASLPSNTYLCGTDKFTLLDCRLVPMLYHLETGIEGFKGSSPSLETDYPQVHSYIENAKARPSFEATIYPKDTVLWGWGNARQ